MGGDKKMKLIIKELEVGNLRQAIKLLLAKNKFLVENLGRFDVNKTGSPDFQEDSQIADFVSAILKEIEMLERLQEK